MNSIEIIRLRNVVNLAGSAVSFFDGQKKYYSTGDFDTEKYELVTFENRPSRANLLLKEGQITLAKMKGTEKIKFVSKEMEDNIYSTGFFALEPKHINKQYLVYVLKSAQFIQEKNSFSFGTTQFSIAEDKLKNIELTIVADEHKQEIIVNKLNHIIENINKLIEVESNQIEKLKEYNQSIIAEIVTHGLQKNVALKNSNIEWLGQIPENWKMVRIKDIFNLKNEKTEKTDLSNVNLISLYTDKGVVQHSDLVETTGNRAVTAEGYKIVNKNDIVVNIILCWMGAIGMSNFDGVTSPAYDIYSPNKDVCSKYYHYLFRTKRFNGECFRYGRGIMLMRWRTYSAEFSSIFVPNPSYAEQVQIVNYLDSKSLEIDELIRLKQKKIGLLNEYKESLIYEYVTGKREVKEG